MAQKASVKTSTVTVTTVSQKILEANAERKYLSLQNKSGDNTILVKFGSDFVQAVNEVQKITFDPVLQPTSGSFKLKYGATKTAAINYDAVDTDVQAALRAISGLEAVDVSGDFYEGFTVTFSGDAADMALLEVTDNTLASSEEDLEECQLIAFSAAPTSGNYKVKYGANKTAAIAFDDDAAAVQVALRLITGLEAVDVEAYGRDGLGFYVTFTGTFDDVDMLEVTDSTLIDEEVEADEVQELYMTAEPTEGTFKLQYGLEGEGEKTAALNYNATAAEIQTALRALTNISNDTVVAGIGYQKVKLVMRYTVNALEEQPYIISTQMDDYTYLPDGVPESANEVVEAIMALINAASEETFVASLDGTAPNQTLLLTAKTAGETFDTEPSSNMTEAVATANQRGMQVTFTGADGYADRPMIQPCDLSLKRYGEEVRMDVYEGVKGVAPGAVTAEVTEAQKGAADADQAGSVTTLAAGVAYQNEGTVLEPGARISTKETVFVDDVWAMCDDETALLEIMEG